VRWDAIETAEVQEFQELLFLNQIEAEKGL
jgi:hypothetical protein